MMVNYGQRPQSTEGLPQAGDFCAQHGVPTFRNDADRRRFAMLAKLLFLRSFETLSPSTGAALRGIEGRVSERFANP